MEKVTFEITEEEVRGCGEYLNKNQIKEVLSLVENDEILWRDIVESIKDAIDHVKDKL